MKKILGFFLNMKKNSGYTIVELLAVVTILVAVAGIISALITQTLRGSSRTNITNQVSQTGNYVTSVITNSIITAENVVAVGGEAIADCTLNPTGNSIELLVSQKRGTILYECSSDTISSNSASLIDTERLRINTNDAAACYFTCRQQSNDPYTPPVIEFGFTLTQKSEEALFESRAQAPFTTSALMRNYQP